jgi:hypothetical protein
LEALNVKFALVVFASITLAASAMADEVKVCDIEDGVSTGTGFVVDKSGELNLSQAGGTVKKLKCDEIVRIEFPAGAENPYDVELRFTNGDRLRGTLGQGKDSCIGLKDSDMGAMDVKIEHLSSMIFRERASLVPPDAAADDKDVVYLANQDTDSGIINSAGDAGIEVKSATFNRTNKYETKAVAGMTFTQVSPPPREPDALVAIVETHNGSKLTGSISEVSGDVLKFISLYGTAYELRVKAARMIYFKNGKCVYLSDMQASSVQEYAPVTHCYPYQKDSSAVLKRTIRLGNRDYRKGLGVHSYSKLTYKLDGRFKRFKSVVGLDEEAEKQGSVVFRVHADGKKLFDSGLMEGAAPAKDVDLNVEGVSELVLELLPSLDEHPADQLDKCPDGKCFPFDDNDRAAWADARLIRK